MRTWAINLIEAPWWVLVLIVAGTLLELWHETEHAIDPQECASACYPLGIARYSTTECVCREAS